jgi:hypothetical protein
MITSHQIEEMYKPSVEWLKTLGYKARLWNTERIQGYFREDEHGYEYFVFDNTETIFVYSITDYIHCNDYDLSKPTRVVFSNATDCLEKVKFYSL